MERQPLKDVRARPPRKVAFYLAIADSDGDLVLAIDRVERRWIMIPVQHGDRDAKDARNDGHARNLELMPVTA